MSMPVEPVITINGVLLTDPQAMSVRCAVSSFATHLYNDGLGNDAHGKAMVKGYLKNLASVNNLILLNQP